MNLEFVRINVFTETLCLRRFVCVCLSFGFPVFLECKHPRFVGRLIEKNDEFEEPNRGSLNREKSRRNAGKIPRLRG